MNLQPNNSGLPVAYAGKFGKLLWLAIKTLLLTVVTLGIYRFWMKTRMRRYYWSSVRPGDMSMEYTGTGLEKLLGFLIAVVILAIYLGIVNLLLTFVGFSILSENEVISGFAANLSFLAVVPLIYYARYRGRRYILSRTVWRGLRFGADKAAAKYMLVACGHSLLSLVTLGLLIPRQTFKLEKFVTDRTWYGTAKFHQNGNWGMLFKPWLAVIVTVALAVGSMAALYATENPVIAVTVPITYLLVPIALVYYTTASFRLLTNHKTLGDSVGFRSTIRTPKVIGIYLIGIAATLVFMLVTLAVAIFCIAMVAGMSSGDFDANSIDNFFEGLEATDIGDVGFPAVVIAILTYFFILLMLGALAQVFFIQPILRHYVV